MRLIAIILTVILSMPAIAATQDFSKLAEDIAGKCNFEAATCTSHYSARALMREDAIGLFKRFDKKAKGFASQWGDTILEGDYHAFGSTKAFRAVEYSENGRVVAYQMEYYEEAIETGGKKCLRDEGMNDDAWAYYGECTLGRIFEVVYLSKDLTKDAADEQRFANFFASAQDKEKNGYPH